MLQQFKTTRYIKTTLVLHVGEEHPNTGIKAIYDKKSVRILAPNESSYDTMPEDPIVPVPYRDKCAALLDPTRQTATPRRKKGIKKPDPWILGS